MSLCASILILELTLPLQQVNNAIKITDMTANEDLEEKKLLGSGGYAFAKLTEQEELRANLGVPPNFSRKRGKIK